MNSIVQLFNHCSAKIKCGSFNIYPIYDPVYEVNTFLTLVAVTIKDLTFELSGVVKWFDLGIQLDMSTSQLEIIREDHRNQTNACKTAMLVMWQNQTPNASWSTVVEALQRIDMQTLAKNIAEKYGELVLH